MTKKNKKSGNNLFSSTETVARLLILLAIQNGANSSDIAEILGVDDSTIRHNISMKKIKRKK